MAPRALPRPPSSSSSESSSISDGRNIVLSYPERLEIARAAMMSVPQELFPASDSSPLSEARVAQLREEIVYAIGVAEGEPSNPKWGHVSRLVKLGCTSLRYAGTAPGVRMGDVRRAESVEGFEFVLPDTEEEWEACEERWAQWKERSATADVPVRVSKYWTRESQGAADEPQDKPVLSGPKAEFVRKKVANWQATLVGGGEDAPLSPVHEEPIGKAAAKPNNKGREKGKEERVLEGTKSQTSLGFSVVKRAGTLTGKSSKGTISNSGSQIIPTTAKPPSPLDAHMKSPSPEITGSLPVASLPSVHTNRAQITDVSEMSFLPPSFPSQLPTSTPVPADPSKASTVRRKPSPIAPRPSMSTLSSPPQSQPLPTHLHSLQGERMNLSSSQPASSLSSPTKRPQKRTLSRTPPPIGKSILSTYGLSYMTPPKKKPRLEQGSTSSGLPPPSTPPGPATSQTNLLATPPPRVSTGKELGNARGLPVPVTPDRQALPTLTELLASSRRSKPRPRPPSRKHKSETSTPNAKGKYKETDTQLPALDDDDGASRTKSYFSSPASGSSDSPSSLRQRPRSPVSPLFSQNPGAFAPPYASTQQPAAGGFLGVGSFDSGPGALLARGSSGFFGMGYNSQFDVERQVDRVSELLERDVDYDGWLRDLPNVEEPSHGGPLTQSQGEVRV
ncbi:hypothetical protein B0H21DRAFT_39264 [Amylocystis lapponica]|nr:hypothetical protein B0H21DRAFT_39264 [Amylocystis lapponica]